MPSTLPPWRTFSIFISSTFADMQAERDHLKNVVFPKVEEELQQRRIKLEIVDLRWGVDTISVVREDEREANVLKVCLDEIKRCRPFFIGLLGDRYGWVPPLERIEKAVAGEDIEVKGKVKSVTALEIEFGVLASKEQLTRSVFYFRERLPYHEFSDKRAAMFSDEYNPELSEIEKAERKTALHNLKSSIREHFEKKKLKDKVKTYSGKWDAAKEKVTGLEVWGDIVYDDILAECENHAKETWDNVPKNWQEQELALLEAFIETNTQTFCGRKPLLEDLKNHLLSDDTATWGLALTGESGSGKSAVFSMMNKMMQQEDCFILAHSAGLSPKAKNVANLLQIWNRQLADLLGIKEAPIEEMQRLEELTTFITGQHEKFPATPIEKLQEKFLELLQLLAANKLVVLLIDALDRFEPTARAQHLSWLPGLMPRNVRLLITAITGTEQKAVKYQKGLKERSIDVFSPDEAKEMLQALCKRQHKTLPEKLVRAILGKMRNDGQPAACSPLWLSLAVNMLMALDYDDFEKISCLGGGGGEQIESYMSTMAVDFDSLPSPLFLSLVNKAGTVFGESFTQAVFNYLACSRNGLREKDLANLLPADNITWDSLQFANLRRWFKVHLILQGEEMQWNLAHSILRNALTSNIEEVHLIKLHGNIANYLSTLSFDPLQASETLYHLLHSGRHKEAALYYSGALTFDEAEGATKVLTETIIADEKGFELACSFPSMVVQNHESFHGLLKRYIYYLNEALKVEGNLNRRLALLEKINKDLEKAYQSNIPDVGFGIDTAALSEKLGDIHQAMGHMEKALYYFDNEVRLFEELYTANPKNELLKDGLAVSYTKLGDIQKAMGHLEEALKYFEKSLVLGQELYDAKPWYDLLKGHLEIAYERLGDIHKAMGHTEEALNYLEKFSVSVKDRFDHNPQNEMLKNGLAISFENLGDIHQAMGHIEEALNYYDDGVKLAKELYTANPQNESLKEGLAIFNEKLGDLHQVMGSMEQALNYFEKDLELTEELYDDNPQNETWKHGLATCYERLGDIHQEMGHTEEALRFFEKRSVLGKELYDANPQNEMLKNGLAISYERLGCIHQEIGHMDEALKYFEKYLVLGQELYDADPHNELLKDGLAISFEKMGYIQWAMGHLDKALDYFQQRLVFASELYEANPHNESLKYNLASSYSNLGDIHQAMGHMEKALTYFDDDVKLFKELNYANPQDVKLLEGLGISYNKVAMIYKALGNNTTGKENFAQWKNIISFLSKNLPQVSKYREWDKIQYD